MFIVFVIDIDRLREPIECASFSRASMDGGSSSPIPCQSVNGGKVSSSSWSHVVRGQPSSAAAATVNSEEIEGRVQQSGESGPSGIDGNDHSKPEDLVQVIGGEDCWPALQDARNSPKTSVPQGSSTQVLPTAVPFKKAADNTSPRLSNDHVFINQQKFAGKRGSANGIMPPFSSTGMPPSSRIPNKLLPVSDVRAETGFKGNRETGVKGFIPMPGGNEYTRPPFQRGVRSFIPQGDPNQYLSSYGHRPNNIHEQRRPNYDWNSQQALYGTDNTAMYQRVGPRNMGRPPPPLVPPNHGLTNHPGFHAIPTYYFPPRTHLDSVRGGPYFAPAPPSGVFFSGPDPHLRVKILNQIEYYFSVENLCKDPYLRQNMDGQGWVPVSLIATFRRVAALTSDVNLIINALRNSSVVEVKGDKIRRRGDWSKWLLPDRVNKSTLRTQSQGSSINVKTSNVEKDATLDGQITSVSSRHLIGSPLTENGVQSGVLSKLETTSDHGLSKRTFPEGDISKGILDIRINDMG